MTAKTIFIIDDSRVFLELMTGALKKAGYEVEAFQDGREALGRIGAGASAGPDLAVVDIIMPDMDGLDVIATMKRSLPSLKIIAVSGGGEISPGQYLRVAESLGVELTLQKPFGADELLTATARLLEND